MLVNVKLNVRITFQGYKLVDFKSHNQNSFLNSAEQINTINNNFIRKSSSILSVH